MSTAQRKALADDKLFSRAAEDIMSMAEYASRDAAIDDARRDRLRNCVRTIEAAVHDIGAIMESLEAA